jgi:hypothetical protein
VESSRELLRRHLPVKLLGATGRPVRYHWVEGNTGFHAPRPGEAELPLTWNNPDWSMLELMDSVPLERYRLSAEVLHRDSATGSLIGVYFLRRALQLPRGKAHLLASVLFNDHDPGSSRHASLSVWRDYCWPSTPQRSIITLEAERLPALPPRRPPARNWHRIVVTVTPEKVQATLDDTLVLEHQRADLERQARSLVPEPESSAAPPGTLLASGLGLLVFRGTASFRNVELKSLPEKE